MKKTVSSSISAPAALSTPFVLATACLVMFAANINYAQGQTIPPAPQDVGAPIGYENFAAPGVLVPAKTSEGGQQPNSVEYMGRNAGEPSVGSDWATGLGTYQLGFETLFITFNDTCLSGGQGAAWVSRP